MDTTTQKATLLIVDDMPENIDVLRGILKEHYKLKIATDGPKALKIATSEQKPDIILLDIMMPGMDGYEVCRKLKENYNTVDIPVIFVTAKGEVEDESHGFDVGAVDYITKPVSAPLVLRRVQTHLNLYDNKRLLDSQVREKTRVINETRIQIIRRLGRAAEYKDNETGMHVMRMSYYSQKLALAAGMSEQDAELVLNASPMHDIGKIGVADKILLKPGKLDREESDIIQQHPQIGADIIGEHDSILLKTAREIALTHHEKYNGKGYPQGLKGKDIPLMGRITAITDVFDALTSERPYKKSWTVDDALNLIKEEAGEHFDPELVEKFLEIISDILKLKDKYAEQTD